MVADDGQHLTLGGVGVGRTHVAEVPDAVDALLDDPDTWNKAYEDVVANGQAVG